MPNPTENDPVARLVAALTREYKRCAKNCRNLGNQRTAQTWEMAEMMLQVAANQLQTPDADEAAALRQDKERLEWLIQNSAIDDSESLPLVLIVTTRAVPKCDGTHLPQYHADVRAAIDSAMRR